MGGGRVGAEAGDGARLVVVLEVERVPARVDEHHGLPFRGDGFQFRQRVGAGEEFVVREAVEGDSGERGGPKKKGGTNQPI